MASRSVIVLPEDSQQIIVQAIAQAAKSLRIKMFVFSDPGLLEEVVRAKRRGVDVRVMLNPARRDGESDNATARATLTAAGVAVNDSNPAFSLTHEKSMVVDDTTGYVKSLNWETRNLTGTRDYAIVTDHRAEVEEIVACFEADWSRQKFKPRADSSLIWCPIDGRERFCEFIDNAQHKLILQNERFQDAVVIERLVRAANRGVKVRVMARPAHSLKIDKIVEGVGGLRIMDDVGIKVHRIKHVRMHAKMMLADGLAAIVGSIALTTGSFDERRELAIEVRDDEVVERLHDVAERDWENSKRIDLSDEGLIAEFKDRKEETEALEELALEGGGKAKD
jgi:phosphatidylserine/phosphatidylglycerophosphate/cardiolipin synthase-like enzyme